MPESSTETSRMTRTELYAGLTLWLAAFVFLDTVSGTGIWLTAATAVAGAVAYFFPFLFALDVLFRFFEF